MYKRHVIIIINTWYLYNPKTGLTKPYACSQLNPIQWRCQLFLLGDIWQKNFEGEAGSKNFYFGFRYYFDSLGIMYNYYKYFCNIKSIILKAMVFHFFFFFFILSTLFSNLFCLNPQFSRWVLPQLWRRHC